MHRHAGRHRYACAALCWGIVLACYLVSASNIRAQEEPLTRAIAPLYHSTFQYVGSFSCAAVACHQGPRPGLAAPEAERGSEYGLWAERDPHARAHDTLSNDESTGMLARLGIVRDGQVVDPKGYDNCLRCHSLAPAAAQLPANWEIHEGVSCEGCHGPAQHWLVDHAQRDWQREQGVEQGMLDLKNLLVRARLCADCHVGSVDREVNHDMIAAGHPALRFEMSADHARLPKHWREAREDDIEFEWSLWLAGQIASAEAALKLSHARQTNQATFNVWPEFAEYNCGDCHHALDVPTAREQPEFRARSVPRWGDWHFTYLAAITGEHKIAAELPQQMVEAFLRSGADSGQQVRAAERELNEWIGKHFSSSLAASDLDAATMAVGAHVGLQAERGPASWEEAAQTYLALRARDAASLRAEDPAHSRLRSLVRMREALRFDEAREFRLFFSAPRAENTIPYDEFQRELKQYVREAE